MQDSERYLVVGILLTLAIIMGRRAHRAYQTGIFTGRGRAERNTKPKLFWLQFGACLIFSGYCLWFALWLLLPEMFQHPPLMKQYLGQYLD